MIKSNTFFYYINPYNLLLQKLIDIHEKINKYLSLSSIIFIFSRKFVMGYVTNIRHAVFSKVYV